MSSKSRKAVPEASQAMEQFKYEVANEIGVPLKQGYNGDLTSAQNGYVGGYMVNNIYPEQNRKYLRNKEWKIIIYQAKNSLQLSPDF